MLDRIAVEHGMDTSFWSLPSCFYNRNMDCEEAFCYPYTQNVNDSRLGETAPSHGVSRLVSNNSPEISYTLRYPEFKESENRWVIRQSAVYHCYNFHTGRSTLVLFSPLVNSLAHQKAEQYLAGGHDRAKGPFWLHEVVFSTYFPAWRQYITHMERELLPIVCPPHIMLLMVAFLLMFLVWHCILDLHRQRTAHWL